MKISTRISIYFSLISSLTLIIFGITVYLLDSNHTRFDFSERLKKRVLITENFFLEKESFSHKEFEKIRAQFLHTLPQETEEVILLEDNITPNFKYDYPEAIKTELLNNETHSFEQGKKQGESKKFQIKGKNYLIIVTGVDEVGIQNLSYLFSRIVLLTLLGLPVILLLSFLITKRVLRPISIKIQRANEISASNLDQRLQVINPNDEIGKLAIAFNKLLDRLEKSFESQKAFISNASHEIRNPLTAIMGEAEVTSAKSRTINEYKESLGVILQESERLNSTVNNLLQLSKVTANEEGFENTNFKFDDFLIEIKESYHYLNPDNQIVVNIEKNQYNIIGNKNLLKTAIINLFENACKYSFNKEVKVFLSARQNSLFLSIKDEGVGIPEKDILRIKEPFYRANNVRNINGSGIGLALSSKIINLHKGEISIKSQQDVGTEIIIKLPIL